MSDRVNRREIILQTASRLFEKQGYQATSTRQIAEEVGCTEAALYYHFKDGKHALLRAVIESHLPQIEAVMDQCCQAASLKEALALFGRNFAAHTPGMRWLIAEIPHLDEAEREGVLANFSTMRQSLVQTLRQFVKDDKTADQIAWLMLCIGAGYQQLFSEATFRSTTDISMSDMMSTLLDLMA